MKHPYASLITAFYKLNDFSRLKSNIAILIISLITTVLLGIADYYTTPDFTFSIFYLIPVSYAAWYAGKRQGFLTSSFCTFTAYVVHLLWPKQGVHYLVPYWDALTLFIFLTVTTVILSKLRVTVDNESAMARTDYLTGISNSRYFFELADNELKRARRKNAPLTLVFMDLDNFKEVNDELGHSTGNLLLQKTAETIKGAIREIDLPARLGGDEFVVLLPDSDYQEAGGVIARIMSSLTETFKRNGWNISVSIGAATCSIKCTVDSLLKTADNLMYEAKAQGKNRIIHRVLGTIGAGPDTDKTTKAEDAKQ